jgi:hypothetical protein
MVAQNNQATKFYEFSPKTLDAFLKEITQG